MLSPRKDDFLSLPGVSSGISGENVMPVKYRLSILNKSHQLLQL